MITEQLKGLVEDIDALIDDDSLSSGRRADRLWDAAQAFWREAFPPDIGPDERRSVWLGVTSQCNIDTRKNGSKIIDVLRWPATGDQPTWI